MNYERLFYSLNGLVKHGKWLSVSTWKSQAEKKIILRVWFDGKWATKSNVFQEIAFPPIIVNPVNWFVLRRFSHNLEDLWREYLMESVNRSLVWEQTWADRERFARCIFYKSDTLLATIAFFPNVKSYLSTRKDGSVLVLYAFLGKFGNANASINVRQDYSKVWFITVILTFTPIEVLDCNSFRIIRDFF